MCDACISCTLMYTSNFVEGKDLHFSNPLFVYFSQTFLASLMQSIRFHFAKWSDSILFFIFLQNVNFQNKMEALIGQSLV